MSLDMSDRLRMLTAPRRNNYFYGKRLDVPQFCMEQEYGRDKQWLLNRLTLGKGVLCGLTVTTQQNTICVSPGVAIDGLGREIVVNLQSCIDPWAPPPPCCGETEAGTTVNRAPTGTVTLWLCYRECLTDQMPTLVSDCEVRQECMPGTIVETFALKLTDGAAPVLGDPPWCAKMLPQPTPPRRRPLRPRRHHQRRHQRRRPLRHRRRAARRRASGKYCASYSTAAAPRTKAIPACRSRSCSCRTARSRRSKPAPTGRVSTATRRCST